MANASNKIVLDRLNDEDEEETLFSLDGDDGLREGLRLWKSIDDKLSYAIDILEPFPLTIC